jgi:RimJ/RimL family protein N-acetyltransferase
VYITNGNLTIRNALPGDAPQLCRWWNDGAVMAHAGFPNGLGTSARKIRKSLKKDSDEDCRRLIVELGGRPVGEMNYRRKDENTAEIGIKICDFTEQNRGYGAALLRMLITALFAEHGFGRIVLDTNVNNLRAQHVYEKIGCRRVGVREDSWKDQLGRWQSAVDYELHKEDWTH